MTLFGRNSFFRVGIAFCAVFTLLLLAASFFVLPAYQSIQGDISRPADFFQVFLAKFFENNFLAVHVSMVIAVFFSLIGIILILSFFEQTSAPEILYIAIFTISLSFETIRIILPLYFIYDIPSLYLLIAARVLLFARFFGIFSLFAASISAAGLDVQLTRNVILVIIIATLVMIGVPIDTQNWDTSLNIVYGFNSMFRIIELIVILTTVVSFFIAVHIRGTKEYAHIGIGLMIALIGRYFLLYSDSWAGPVPGVLMLSFGIWFVCSKLHKIYLWL